MPLKQHAQPNTEVASPTSQWVKLLVACAIFFAIIYWVKTSIGFDRITEQWSQLSPLHFLSVFALLMLSQLLRGWRISSAYKMAEELHLIATAPSLRRATGVSLIHNAANFMLPMRLGELVFPALSKKSLDIPVNVSAKSLIGIRLLDLYTVLLLLVAVQIERLSLLPTGIITLIGALSVSGIFILYFIQHIPLINKLAPPQFEQWANLLTLIAQTLIIWVIKLTGLFYLFSALLSNETLLFSQVSASILLADLSGVLPINGIASAGSYEAAFNLGLSSLGDTHTLSLKKASTTLMAGAINLHIMLILTNCTAFILGMAMLNKNK